MLLLSLALDGIWLTSLEDCHMCLSLDSALVGSQRSCTDCKYAHLLSLCTGLSHQISDLRLQHRRVILCTLLDCHSRRVRRKFPDGRRSIQLLNIPGASKIPTIRGISARLAELSWLAYHNLRLLFYLYWPHVLFSSIVQRRFCGHGPMAIVPHVCRLGHLCLGSEHILASRRPSLVQHWL